MADVVKPAVNRKNRGPTGHAQAAKPDGHLTRASTIANFAVAQRTLLALVASDSHSDGYCSGGGERGF